MHLGQSLLDYFFPKVCLLCEQPGEYLCRACNKKLEAHPPVCPGCYRPTKIGATCLDCQAEHYPLDGVVIGFSYTSGCKHLVWQMKYQRRYEVALFFAEKLALHLHSHPLLHQNIDSKNLLLTYVPMHRWKQHFLRGFNQSKLLANYLGSQIDASVHELTRKIRHTRSQTRFSRQQRRENIKGVFRPTSHQQLSATTILIVDDIITTGTTLAELARQIKSTYPGVTIWGVVVARHSRF